MSFLEKIIVVATILFLIGGCTLSFKAKEIELEGERQRVNNNTTYELQEATLL